MRPALLAVVSLVAAACGGIAVLVAGKAAGWIDGGRTTTVVVGTTAAPVSRADSAAVRPSGRPRVGNGFDPARIYRLRSAGVVTIYSYFGGSFAGQAQGSGFVASRSGYILTNSHVITNPADQGGERSTQ